MKVGVYLFLMIVLSQPSFAISAAQNRNRINGRVATVNDKPIENVRVTLLSDRLSQVGVEYTDSSGRYNFENLPRGTYSILVEPIGLEYERKSAQVDVNPFVPSGQGGSETFRIDFVLQSSGKKEAHTSASGNIVFYQKVPDEAKKQYRRGFDALKNADFTTAAAALGRAIEIFPDYYDALELLGTEHVKRREYDSALPHLTRAVEVNRGDWRGFYSLGIALTEVKRAGEAVTPLRRAVELNPRWAFTHMRLGIALGHSEATREEAIEALKRAIKIGENKPPEAFLHLALLYHELREYQNAADALESYLQSSEYANLHPEQKEYYQKQLEQLRQKAASRP